VNENEAAVAASPESPETVATVTPLRAGTAPQLTAAAEYLGKLHGQDRHQALQRMLLLVPESPEDGRPRFQFVNLADIAAGSVEPPSVLHDGVIVQGRINWLSGHPGNGKTTLAMHIAVEHMEAGGHVLWLDWENGAGSATRRLIAVGVKLDMLAGQFHYVSFPLLNADGEGFEPIRAFLEEHPGALVVFDSASKALSHAGLGEDSNEEATRWTTNIVIPTREAGATVIVVDHVTKAATRSTPYPRGAGAKLADTDVNWYVEASERFDRDHAGRIRLTNHKDREGVLAAELQFAIGDGQGGLPITPVEAGQDTGVSGLRSAVVAALAEHSSPEKPLSQRQVEGLVAGDNTRIRDELRRLAADPSAPVQVRPGSRNSLLYWFEESETGGLDV
jgi:hypothetical protein